MSSEIVMIRSSLEKVCTFSRRMHVFFSGLLVALCIVGTIMSILVVLSLVNPSLLPFDSQFNASSLFLLLVGLAIAGGALVTMRSIFADMGNGESPFSLSNSIQLRRLGYIFLAGVLLNFIIPPAFSEISHIGAVNIGYVASQAAIYPIFSIDIKGIVGAIVCFMLSVIWRYGALLQAESDEMF